MTNAAMTKRLLLQGVAAGLLAGCLPAEQRVEVKGLDEAALSMLDRHFAEQVSAGHRSGYVYVLAQASGPVHVGAVGRADIEANLPMTADTGFRIASMTKAITSVAAMTLLEAGRMALEDPVSRYIPEFADTPVFEGLDDAKEMRTAPQATPMTVFHLMTHTSGLDFTTNQNAAVAAQGGAIFQSLESHGNLADQAARFAETPLAFQPGKGWGYGASTDVLGRVVEVAAGEPLEAYVRRVVLDPLGMSGTFFIGAEHGADGLAKFYGKTPDGLRAFPAPADNIKWAAGGMGMASTAPDYLRMLRMLANGGAIDGVRVLSSQSVAALTTNALPRELMPIEVGTPVSPGAGHSLGFGVVVDDPASPAPHRVGDYRWGGSTGTAYFVSPDADLIGVIMAQYAVPQDGSAEAITDFISTKDDFSRLAFAAV